MEGPEAQAVTAGSGFSPDDPISAFPIASTRRLARQPMDLTT